MSVAYMEKVRMEMEKLKPCPFCGGKARINLFLGNYCVTCDECAGAIFPCKGMKRKEAVKQWNRRKKHEKLYNKTSKRP